MNNFFIPQGFKPTYGLCSKIPMRMRITSILLAGFSISSKCGGYLFSVNPYIAEYE